MQYKMYSWLFTESATPDHPIMHVQFRSGVTIWQRVLMRLVNTSNVPSNNMNRIYFGFLAYRIYFCIHAGPSETFNTFITIGFLAIGGVWVASRSLHRVAESTDRPSDSSTWFVPLCTPPALRHFRCHDADVNKCDSNGGFYVNEFRRAQNRGFVL